MQEIVDKFEVEQIPDSILALKSEILDEILDIFEQEYQRIKQTKKKEEDRNLI